jgi:hypothetical protein
VNPKRLAELQHQRDLLREHLAWLERQIADERGITAAPVASTAPAPTVTSIAVQRTAGETMPQPNPVEAAASVRRGCFVVFFLVLAIGALALFAVYWFRYRDRPLLFVPQDPPPAKSHESSPSQPRAQFFSKLTSTAPV